MCAQGQSLEHIYLELLEPTVKYLGDLWSADARDFVAITVAMLRLQEILHEFGPAFRRESDLQEHGSHVLLVPAPGEKDTFGHLIFGTFRLVIAAEFLRRDGWDAYVDASATANSAASLVRDEWFDMVEISLSSDTHMDQLTSGIRRIRKTSRNRSIGIIVTGPSFREHPELASSVGADVAASDTRQCAQQAARFVDQRRPR
jgi:methanogenic corrinoid protein MtbC1